MAEKLNVTVTFISGPIRILQYDNVISAEVKECCYYQITTRDFATIKIPLVDIESIVENFEGVK